MKEHTLTWPMLGLIAGTRAVLGAGLALLLADRLNPEQRRAAGWSLFSVGLLTTIPLMVQLRIAGEEEYESHREAKAPERALEPAI